MEKSVLNEAGNWEFPWTAELKASMKKNSKNTNIGQQLLLETAGFKVWSIHLPSGKSLPFHKHNRPYFYTAKTEGRSRSFYTDGTIIETEYKKDDIQYFNYLNDENYFIHNLENIGNTTLIFTTVEFKI